MEQKKDENFIVVRQESSWSIFQRVISNRDMWREFIYSNFFQLLPVEIMMFMQLVSEYKNKNEDILCNILAFGIIACITNLSGMLEKKDFNNGSILNLLMLSALIFILCFSIISYCLILLYGYGKLYIDLNIMATITIVFTGCTVLISMWQVVRKREG